MAMKSPLICRHLCHHGDNYFAPVGLRSIVMNMHVSLSACVCVSLYLSTRITQKPGSRTSPNFFMHFDMAMSQSSSDGTVIHYVLPVLRITLCFYTMKPMDGWMGMVLCSSPAPVDVATGWALAAAAHWLTGSVGRLAGVCRPGRVLAVWRVDLGTVVHVLPCASC